MEHAPSCFTTLVVTCPDAAAAKATAESNGPLSKAWCSSFAKVIATSDPFDARCGSGGGTLAALDLTSPDETVLIIHAGGESSRCPTQMALGKAWTSLPTKTGILNPTNRMVQQLSGLFHDLPRGSVVVAASDTLLTLPMENRTIDWTHYPDSVIGLAVPAPLETAKNHGVYCVNSRNAALHAVHEFLQKPTLQDMRQTNYCVFSHNGEDSAWIDTGVVVFLPKPAAALRALCDGSLACCTERGLVALHEQSTAAAEPPQQSLHDFGCNHALRVELYSHFLLSLSTITGGTNDLEEFLASQHDLPVPVLTSIYNTLSAFQLAAIVLPQGQFLHLGTSRELVDFMVHGTHGGSTKNHQRCLAFGQDLGLVKRIKAYCLPSDHIAKTAVLVNCVVASVSCVVGECSVLEHCSLDVHDICIGKDCLVSGIRGTATQLFVPDNMCLQMLPLSDGGHVYMYLGLADGIKSGTTYYGIQLHDLLQGTGLTANDLWPEVETKQILWTANLHPVVCSEKPNDLDQLEHASYFTWITELQKQGSNASLSAMGQASLQRWKAATRLPLNEIRHRTDTKQEWTYRSHLEETRFQQATNDNFNLIKGNLLERRHVESNLDYIVDAFACTKDNRNVSHALEIIDEVIEIAIGREDYDIASRAFMVSSALLESLATTCYPGIDNMETERISFDVHALTSSTASVEEREIACMRLMSLRDMRLASCLPELTAEAHRSCSVAMEQAASALTALCICGTVAFDSLSAGHREPPVLDKWVIATAPARIDLSGGWSDTPPVCYEYGGAVCGVAVTVDGYNPVSCRCRIVKGREGILLRTESRNWTDGELVTVVEAHLTTVADLVDFRDPLAEAALIKCALVYFGLVPMEALTSRSTAILQPFVDAFCGVDEKVRLEIISTSLLPRGSGMGTSSILGGCILAAIAKCVGMDIGCDDDNHLTQIVLMVEQLLTTGGGWQDQIGGLVGGFKLGTSKPNKFPLSTNVERIQVAPSTVDQLNDRLVLVFTGQTRLAKNILQNVLRRWARRTEEILTTVQDLVNDAHRVTKALKEGDIDVVADCLNRYWSQKKVMAGADSGVEPPIVRSVLQSLLERDLISAGSLCGAGGGGFMVMLVKEGITADDVRSAVQKGELFDPSVRDFTWHDCRVSENGLKVTILDTKASAVDWFDIAWHEV